MNRLCLTMVGLGCAVASTQVQAETSSASPTKPVRAHPTKIASAAVSRPDRNEIHFSDPYAPPIGSHKLSMAQFPPPRDVPADPPQGSLTIGVGRDSPDAPFTGGFKLKF
jgi:hypothetical protein